MCTIMCGFERGGGTLGGLGDRDREKGDRDGWPALAGREASMAVTAVAIKVAVRANLSIESLLVPRALAHVHVRPDLLPYFCWSCP